MSRPLFGFLVLAGAIALSGCGFLGLTVPGSGLVEEQTYSTKEFEVVEAGYGFDVDVQPGPVASVVVRTDDNIMPYVVVKNEDNRLVITLETGRSYMPTTLRAIVTLPTLTGLDLSGGTVGYVAAGFETPAVFRLVLSGGSTVSVGSLACGGLGADLSGGSTLAGEIHCGAGEATLSLSGGSHVGTLKGEAGAMTLDQSGGGETDLSAFTVQSAQVTLSGGAVARVAVTTRLGADLSGGSSLEYRLYDAGPVIIGLAVSGGSRIVTY